MTGSVKRGSDHIFFIGFLGAGKSTLFRCLAGWLEPDEGEA